MQGVPKVTKQCFVINFIPTRKAEAKMFTAVPSTLITDHILSLLCSFH